jgi:ATP-dependent helicase/nuclease subunit B
MYGTVHILPSTAAVDAFNRQLLDRTPCLLGVPALTMRRLADEIGRQAQDGRRPISTTGRRLLLREIVRERYGDGTGYFSHLVDFPGFVGALDRFVGEMKLSLVSPGDLTSVASAAGGERLRELAALYRQYDRALAARDLLDDRDREGAAAAHLRADGLLPPCLSGAEQLMVEGLYDFTPSQLALLVALSRRMRVVLRLPYAAARDEVFGYVSRTADAVEALDNSDLYLETEFTEPDGTFLTPLLDALFTPPGERQPLIPTSPLALVAAPGAYRECEEIGRRIRALLDAGTSPGAIAVLFRDTTTTGPMMEDVCRRFRIPLSYRRGIPLAASPLVRVCLAPFAIVASRFGREELLEFWKSTYVELPGRGLDGDLIEEVLLAASYRDESPGTVEEVLDRRIARLKSGGEGCDREERVRRGITPSLARLRAFRGEKTLRQFTLLLEEFIREHRLFQRGIAADDLRPLKRDASAITLFQQTLRALEDDIAVLGMEDETFAPADFADLLRQGLEGQYLAGERGAGVSVMNFHDARGLRFDHLFIAGLNEGICPAAPAIQPLFKEEDRLLCNRLLATRRFRSQAEKAQEEPLLFWLATGCAVISLTLSYAYLDSRGNDLLPSPFLEEVLEVVPLEEERLSLGLITPPLSRCLEREELLNTLAMEGRLDAAQLPASLAESLERIAATAAIEAERERFFAAGEKAVRETLSSPYTGTFRRPEVITLLADFYGSEPGNRFAPTMLEEYGGCPFRYFLKRHLRLAPLELPEAELGARQTGSLVHELLRGVGERLVSAGMFPPVDLPAASALLRTEADRVFARWQEERYTGDPLIWETTREKLVAVLEGWLRAEAEETTFTPAAFEHTFPEMGVEDKEAGPFYLRGKIDRVDRARSGTGLRVVDYKLSGDARKYGELLKKEALGVTSFQMPVYLLAAAEEAILPGAGPEHLVARYWLLKKGAWKEKDFASTEKDFASTEKEDFTGFFATSAEERERCGDDNFLNRLAATVGAIRHGEFQITPRGCGFCDFGGVCRYVEQILQEE